LSSIIFKKFLFSSGLKKGGSSGPAAKGIQIFGSAEGGAELNRKMGR